MKKSQTSGPVILFIPEAGIYPYARGLAVLGDALKTCHRTVYITHDTGQMLRSPLAAMLKTSIHQTPKEKIRIRKMTDRNIDKIKNQYGFLSIPLKNLVDDDLIREVSLLSKNRSKNLKNINYKGCPVGAMAEFDFILETKIPYSSYLSKDHQKLYSQYIANTAMAVAITEKICEIYKPSLILTFNEYAQCQGAWYSAEKYGVSHLTLTYPVHRNIDASRFVIWETAYQHWCSKHIQQWMSWRDIPIKAADVKACWEDSLFRMYDAGSHIFSPRKNDDPKKIFKALRLKKDLKTIVVYTSSQDERNTGEISMKVWNKDNVFKDVFKDQIEWLLMLRDYALINKDIQIVVRIHPREATKEKIAQSNHLKDLKKIFHEASERFTIIWPEDPTSSYDLMELADVCLVSWSLMGQEAARLGIPVLTYISNMFYPNDDFIQVGVSFKDYRNKLENIIHSTTTWGQLKHAIRFYHWRVLIPSFNFGDTVPSAFHDDDIWPRVSNITASTINQILKGENYVIKHNLNQWEKALSSNTATLEDKAIKWGIRYFFHTIFYSKHSGNTNFFQRYWQKLMENPSNKIEKQPEYHKYEDYILEYSDKLSDIDYWLKKTSRKPNLRVILDDWPTAILVHNGKLIRRTSPLIIRLAKLYATGLQYS